MTTDKVVLLHAYDARNRGDGLLVRESLDVLRRAGVAPEACVVVATTASSFDGVAATRQYPVFGMKGAARWRGMAELGALSVAGATSARLVAGIDLGRLVHQARLVIGVGGGYLRSPGGRESALAGVVQLPQLAMAAEAEAPSLYFPQSIGPLRGVVGVAIRRRLKHLTRVYVRDDRSIDETAGIAVRRTADLAILAIARAYDGAITREHGSRIVGIARHLSSGALYDERLRMLDQAEHIEWAVHSRASGQDDKEFYDHMGFTVAGSSEDVLAEENIGAVVSVRLHGALQSIAAGYPTVHLSYDDKGRGAFGDLGISEWLHDAYDFDPALVRDQLQELSKSSSAYWQKINDSVPRLLTEDSQLVADVRSHLES